MTKQKDKILQAVAEQVTECQRCQLHFSRKNAVPGEGPSRAQIMLIGEGPGFYENEQGRPFVGASGNYLDELLQKAGLTRKAVFITNVVKCRPPGNRDPLPAELQACAEFLETQINAINPLIIVTLGRYSMGKFLNNAKISDVHGKPVWVRGRLIVPMFHPAAALHQPSLKAGVEQDFSRLPEFILQAQQGAARYAYARQDEPAVDGSLSEDGQPSQAAQPAAEHIALEQQSLFDGLIDASPPPPEEPAPPEEETPQNDEPMQLSLF